VPLVITPGRYQDLFRFATRAKDFIADTADTTDASELDQLQQPRPSSVKLPSRTPSLTGMGGFKLVQPRAFLCIDSCFYFKPTHRPVGFLSDLHRL
jgi:hypothetical protein